jgi:hypothetical protein
MHLAHLIFFEPFVKVLRDFAKSFVLVVGDRERSSRVDNLLRVEHDFPLLTAHANGNLVGTIIFSVIDSVIEFVELIVKPQIKSPSLHSIFWNDAVDADQN